MSVGSTIHLIYVHLPKKPDISNAKIPSRLFFVDPWRPRVAGFAFPPLLVRQDSVVPTDYCIVYLRNGACSVRSLAEAETFHPGIGPAREAEALYVRQLHLPERVRETSGEFVIWDVGLGAAANALTAIRLVREGLKREPAQLRIVSFDLTTDAAAFALEHGTELGYVTGYESALAELVKNHSVKFGDDWLQVEWTLERGDFPAFLSRSSRATTTCEPERRSPIRREYNDRPQRAGSETGAPPPHAILFDPHSPKKNPAMWTAPLFADLFRQLDPQRSCALATFTRSTMARVALLLGGFFVGVGHPSGLKEETTVAANRIDLLDEPLDRRWLERAKGSHSAEPLSGPVYRQMPLSPETREKLRQHLQFA
jgi:tRNA U34 5-methylaminomethyl-2-thiouridine-forming methyltransferase MnmC